MSNLVSAAEHSDEGRSTARKIDEGLKYLETKFENVLNLGLSVDPQQTKRIGLDVLHELADEIEEMKRDVNEAIRLHQDALLDRIKDNEQVSVFIEQLSGELKEMENQVKARNPNYVSYEPPIVLQSAQEHENDTTDLKDDVCVSVQSSILELRCPIRKTESPETKKYSTMLSVNISHAMNTLNTSVDQFLSPMTTRQETCRRGKNSNRHDHSVFNELDNRSILSEYGDSTSNSLAILEKKLNRTDDNVVKTPVDPGVSITTMQLLGKSNLKTKVFKENLTNIYRSMD